MSYVRGCMHGELTNTEQCRVVSREQSEVWKFLTGSKCEAILKITRPKYTVFQKNWYTKLILIT